MAIKDFIREQPVAIERCIAATLAFNETWRAPTVTGIALVGSGSSFNALTAARSHFVAARRGPVIVYDPEDFVAELPELTQAPLVVVLSQSGASITSIMAAEAAVAAGLPTLAMTATPDARLCGIGAEVLLMPIGDEPVGPKTKGFTGSLATLLTLAQGLGAPAVPAPAATSWMSAIGTGHTAAVNVMPALGGVDFLMFAGRRALFGIALEASLKIAEIAGVPTAACPTEELLHGRLHGLTRRSMAFLFVDGPREVAEARRTAAAMRPHGCRVDIVESAGAHWPMDVAPPAAPWNALGVLLPFQWLAVLLAEARGLEPDAMRYGALSAALAIKTSSLS
jgi:fructoselysine-6-P-deglycase FrlB-like protein